MIIKNAEVILIFTLSNYLDMKNLKLLKLLNGATAIARLVFSTLRPLQAKISSVCNQSVGLF